MHQRKAKIARHSTLASSPFLVSNSSNLPSTSTLLLSQTPCGQWCVDVYGTLEELLEVIAWAELGNRHPRQACKHLSNPHNALDRSAAIEAKGFMLIKVGLLNIDGYYNSLLAFIDRAVEDCYLFLSAPNGQRQRSLPKTRARQSNQHQIRALSMIDSLDLTKYASTHGGRMLRPDPHQDKKDRHPPIVIRHSRKRCGADSSDSLQKMQDMSSTWIPCLTSLSLVRRCPFS
ncbi:cytokinin riboside 5'-monophosphate phosphoribohydrolase LOG1-like isoform X1 [Canna indica]|uniref:Cytokinin riboside 5'-monophosphate phosphoribohydrolase LOG1-like isoform X1 n=1 Tax=Canna indica TaxID=4628 RepID=A0AAQ3QJ68_9LILI|nr:cytokinin riboside 5'-monophosphate phosphoribohydrolase LOG1-like isoform X1 [Canna indica]